MKLSAILAPLIAAKVPHDIILETVKAFEAQQTDALEKRREADRKRQSNKRSRDVTLRHSDRSLVTRVEDSSLKVVDKEVSKRERSPRATRLPTDWTIPEDWLQEAIDAGLTRDQAVASSNRMHNWSLSDTKGRKLNWLATWRNWFPRDLPKPTANAPPKPKSVGQMFHDEAQQMGILDEPDQTQPGHMETSDRGGQGGGTCEPVRLALAARW